MTDFKIQKFPFTRIATIDIGDLGKRKHHVVGLIELDVTKSREKIREYNRNNNSNISFNAWLISVIGKTVKEHCTVASFKKGKNKVLKKRKAK